MLDFERRLCYVSCVERLEEKNIQGPEIFTMHPVIIYDADATLIETYPGLIALARLYFNQRGHYPQFGEAWDVAVFGQIEDWARKDGVPEDVVDKIFSTFWIDPYTYKFAPRTWGSKLLVEWVAREQKRQMVHSSRPPEATKVTKLEVERLFPEMMEQVELRSEQQMADGKSGNDLKISNAEKHRAIFIDDQSSLGIDFIKYIKKLKRIGQEPQSHLIIVPYAKIPIPDELLAPQFQSHLTVFPNIKNGTQDLERVYRFLSGKKIRLLNR